MARRLARGLLPQDTYLARAPLPLQPQAETRGPPGVPHPHTSGPTALTTGQDFGFQRDPSLRVTATPRAPKHHPPCVICPEHPPSSVSPLGSPLRQARGSCKTHPAPVTAGRMSHCLLAKGGIFQMIQSRDCPRRPLKLHPSASCHPSHVLTHVHTHVHTCLHTRRDARARTCTTQGSRNTRLLLDLILVQHLCLLRDLASSQAHPSQSTWKGKRAK